MPISFYPQRPPRPALPSVQYTPTVLTDMDIASGVTQAHSSYNILKEEYTAVEELLEKLLTEQIQQLEQLLIQAKQIKLHLASLSQEDIDDKDAD